MRRLPSLGSCELCDRLTTSAAARAAAPFGAKPFGSTGKRYGWWVWKSVISQTRVLHVCRRCWARHLEVDGLDEPDRHDRAAALVADWLRSAPRAAGATIDSDRAVPFDEAARLCTAGALFLAGDGTGAHAWHKADQRFYFDGARNPAQPGRYDDVLIRYDYFNGYEASVYLGSVRRIEDRVLLLWRYDRGYDSSR